MSTDFCSPTVRRSRSRGRFLISNRRWGELQNNYINHRSTGVRKIADELATARDDRIEYRAKQTIRPRWVMGILLFSVGEKAVSFAVCSLFSVCYFPLFSIMPGTRDEKHFPSQVRAIGMRKPDE